MNLGYDYILLETDNILTFLKTIKKYGLINQNDKIICGVSGGPDSICMLDILKDLKDYLASGGQCYVVCPLVS